ncbi:MAG: hypothetical protein KGL55_13345 [Rhodospirillales bacterium]|nr:hypothetical protein [Rhodospirillales bacterium]
MAQDPVLVAAKLLTPTPKPQLLAAIEFVAEPIRAAITRAAPLTRVQLRKKLAKLTSAARLLRDAFADPVMAGVVRPVAAQWVSREGGVVNERALKALADGLEGYATKIQAGGPGSSTVQDSLGAPRATLLCAVAVLSLFETVRGKRPSAHNGQALELCAALWQLSGGTITRKASDGEVDAPSSWERHLKAAIVGWRHIAAPPAPGSRGARQLADLRSAARANADRLVLSAFQAARLWDAYPPKITE